MQENSTVTYLWVSIFCNLVVHRLEVDAGIVAGVLREERVNSTDHWRNQRYIPHHHSNDLQIAATSDLLGLATSSI